MSPTSPPFEKLTTAAPATMYYPVDLKYYSNVPLKQFFSRRTTPAHETGREENKNGAQV